MVLFDIFLAPPTPGRSSRHVLGAASRSAAAWLLLALAALAYVQLRSWLAVNQLVSIYRKVC